MAVHKKWNRGHTVTAVCVLSGSVSAVISDSTHTSAAHTYTPAEQGPLICYLASIKGQPDWSNGFSLCH